MKMYKFKIVNGILEVYRDLCTAIIFIILVSFFAPTTISAIISIQPNLPLEPRSSVNEICGTLGISCNEESGNVINQFNHSKFLNEIPDSLNGIQNLSSGVDQAPYDPKVGCHGRTHDEDRSLLGSSFFMMDMSRLPKTCEEFFLILNLSREASVLSSEGKYQEAIPYFDKLLAIDPNHCYGLSGKGAVLVGIGKYQEAISYLDSALASKKSNLNCTNADTYNNKGLALYKLGKYQEAIPYFDKALPKYLPSESSASLINKGASLYALGKYQEAINEYDKVLVNDTHNVDALINKGNALSGLGKYQDADQYYDEAIRSIPLEQQNETQFGKMHTLIVYPLSPNGLQQFDQLYKSYLTLPYNQNNAILYLRGQLKNVQYSIQDLKKESDDIATAKYTIFTSLDDYYQFNRPQYIGLSAMSERLIIILVNKGINLYNSTKYEEANSNFDKVLKEDQNNPAGLFYKDLCLQKLSKFGEAKSYKIRFESLNSTYKGEKLGRTVLRIPVLPLQELVGLK